MPPTTFHSQTPESLEQIEKELESLVDSIRLVRTDMQVQNIKQLRVGAYTSLTIGLEKLDGFVAAVRRASRKHREERGDFLGE